MNKTMKLVCSAALKGLSALPVLALLAGVGALPASAAISRTTVKTVTWTLPSDWETQYANSLDQICEPVGAPSMPYYNALIEVPSTATNFAITASGVAYRTTDKERPTPVLEPSVVGEPANTPVEDAALYAGIYPSDAFEQGEKWEMNGKTYLPVRIKVYRWNGPAAKVEALASISLSIACTSPRTGLKLTTSAVPSTKVDYIVISPHNFVEYWKPFVEYRQTTHTNMTFQIVDADDIYSTYKGHDDALKIHHFIEAMYDLGTRYILLGAGAQHTGYDSSSMIMTRIVYTKDRSQSCDYYYCVVDKIGQEVWDYDGDGIYLASKNSSGGYASDAAWKVSWEGKMMVHRFPARTSVSLGGKTRSAKEQIEGYVKKLKRYEQGLFAGRFSQAVIANTLSENYNRYHGNTSADCTQERQFYDLGANIFSEEHGSSISLNEYETRERAPSYYTLYRPVGYNRSVLQLYYSNGETASTFYGRDFDSMIINSHGSPETVEPLNRNGVFGATGLCGFHFLIVPCHAGNPCSGGNTEVSISEAGVVNPEGGSLVSFGNSNTGLWGGKDTFSEKVERDVIKMLYRCQNGAYNDAGTSRLWAMNNYKWTGLSPNSQAGIIMCDTMAYGDPLVKLSPIWSRKVTSDGNWWYNTNYATPCEQEFASALTIEAGSDNNEITITNAIGAATLDISGTSGKTLTLNAEGNGKFKVSNKVTVGNGMTLNWDVPGGFGRNGIQFSNGGNLRLRAEGYYGIEFQGMNGIWIAPPADKTAIVDFDSKSYFRNEKCGNIKVEGPGETIFRSRQAGIFSTTYAIPVTGGTLTLETPCVGGSGQQTSTTPLFAVTNATLAVRPNPNWSAECFSRRVTFENGTLDSRYDKFYLGANVSGYPGLDISVGGTNNNFTGTSPIRLNGQLRIHTVTGGVLNVTGELVNGSSTGSIAIDNGVTLKLAAVNTFSGGVTVPNGARLVVDNVRGLGTGNIVVQSGGVLQLNAMPMAGVASVTLQSGAKLVLKSSGSGGSYQMYSPSTTSFTMADGVKVYDSTNEEKELDGIVTPEGAYFISDAAKYWANIENTTWKNDSTMLAWNKKGETGPIAYADGDTVLFKNTNGVAKVTVPVDGDVAPGMMAFQNTETPYEFTGDGTITVGSMATAGTTSFDPSIKATSQVSVGGKTTLGNVTTPTLNVAGGGKLNMTGTVSGIDTVRVIQFKITDTVGPWNTTPREHAPEMSDLRFYDKNNTQLYFPVGTTVKDNCGSTCTISGKNTSTGAHTFSATSGSVYKLFDQDCSTYHMIGSNIKGPWTITITMPSDTPMEMFAKFKYGRAQKRTSTGYWSFLGAYPDANPRSWVMYAGESESTLKQFTSKSGWVDETASSLTDYMTGSWTSSSKATVQNGGSLVLNGTYNVPVTINSGATLAITNTSMVTFGSTKTWPSGTYAMTVDATQAKKTNGWFQVTKNAGLSSLWSFQTDDETAVDVKSGELWVATAGVMAPPYSRTILGDGTTANWNTTDWKNGKSEPFASAWGSTITKPTGTATLNVTGTNLTMSVDCTVALDTLTITTPTNCFPQTLTVKADGGAANISAIDLRTFNGYVDWQPTLASWGCNVYAGTNSVKITKMTSGTGALQVGEGGKATVPEKFASYDVDPNAYVRFTGTHNFAMSDIPTKGYLSFANTTLSGAFQNSLITYIVENGDTLTFTGASDNYNGRMSSSFDIRGGTVTINSNGASTWFGINGDTTYNQTGGVFKCTANDTSMSANNSGFLVGYSASKTEDFEFNITGGRFELPNTYINFYGPVRFNLSSNGVVQAKGVYRGSNKGTITVNPDAVFEIGSIGLVDGACEFNLYGGTLAGFENNAHTRSSFNLVGLGTLAAKSNTTFTIDDNTISADSATLNFGKEGYTGTVKLETIPEGVTNITVTAGTWDMGSLRPTNNVPVSVLNGTIAACLTADELRQAAGSTGFKLIKTTLTDSAAVQNHVAVTSDSGAAISARGSVKDGYLYINIEWVYPLYGEVKAKDEGQSIGFSDIDWYDSIGLKFSDDWSKVTSAILSNALADVTVTVPNDFTNKLTLVNSGTLALSTTTPTTHALSTIDDSASTGKTTIDICTTEQLCCGAKTVITKRGTSTVTIGAKMAVFADGVVTGKYTIASGGTIRYEGSRSQTCYDATAGVYNNYENAFISVPQASGRDNDIWFKCTEGDYLRAMGEYTDAINALGWNVLVTGGEFHFATNHDGQATWYGRNGRTFTQTGGTTVVETRDTTYGFFVNYAGTSPAGVLTMNISGGLFNCAETRFKFGKAAASTVNVSGGEMKVLGVVKHNTDSSVGGTINLTGGKFSVGSVGIAANVATLALSGGEFHAFDNATLANAFSVANTVRVTTAANKTLTVSSVPTGSGTIVCEPGEGGKVLFTGGAISTVTLDGIFTYQLTSAQTSATQNTNLFKPAANLDLDNVAFVDSDGNEVPGEICLYNGYVTYVPPTGYKLPIVGELYTNSLTSTTYWHDSSDTPKTYNAASLANAAEIVLNVHSNVTLGCNYTATYSSLRICGPGTVDILKNPSVLTTTQCYIETSVVSTNDAVVFTSANIATNGVLTVPVAKAPGSISGKGVLVSDGSTLPTSTGLTDATKWQGTVRLTGTLAKGLNLGSIGNDSSTIEFAGALTDSTDGYLYVPTTVNSDFILSGKMKIQNGNSKSIHAKFCGKFSGDGTFETAGTAPYNKDVFQITGDASGFLGTINLGCVYHDFAFGEQTYGTGGTIFVGNDKGATIADGKQWTAQTEIKVQNGGVLNIAARSDDTASSPSTVTVVSGGYLNLLQTSDDQIVWKITSGTLTLNGGIKVNGTTITADQYTKNGGTITLKGGTLTWNGGTSGEWNQTNDNWLTGSTATHWIDGFADGTTAHFNNDASVTLTETVSPNIIDLKVDTTIKNTEYVQTSSGFLFGNTALSNVTAVAGDMYGAYVSTKGAATSCHYSNDGKTLSVQFQKVDNQLKCVKVVLTQEGNDIYGYASYAKYVDSGTVGSVNFDTASTKGGTVVTSDDGQGYGIKNLALTISRNGTLTVISASNFGKAFIVTNGTLCVASGDLTQDVTLAAGAKINVISTDITNEYVVTSGKVIGGTFDNILFNGSAIGSTDWTLDLENGKLKRIVKPGTTPFTYTISASQPQPSTSTSLWTNLAWVASNWFYVRPEEWVTNTVAEAKLTVDGGVTNTLVANADISINKMTVLNSGYLTITNGQDKTLAITTLDDSASSGTTWLNFPLGTAAITAGSDTILTTTGTGTVTIGAGMKATLHGDAALARTASTISFSEGTSSYRTGALKFDGGQGLTALPSGYIDLFKTTGKYIVDRALSVDGELVFGNANDTRQYSTFEVASNAYLRVTKLHTCNGQNYFQGSQNGGVVEVTSTGEGDGESENAVLFGHWNGQSIYNLNYGQFLVAGGIMLGWDAGTEEGTVFNIGAANETETAYVKAASIRGCSSGNANKTAKLTVYPNGVLETKNGVLMTHSNSAQKQFVLAGGKVRTTGSAATINLVHASGMQVTAPSTLSATNDTVLTVASAITGTGNLTIGEPDWRGTVKFTITNSFTGGISVEYGKLEVPAGALKSDVTLGPDATLNLTDTAGASEYAITTGALVLGEGASITNNITVNGQAFNPSDKWIIENGSLKRVKPTTPFSLTITNSKAYSWKDLAWKGANGAPVWAEDWSGANISAELTVTEAVTAILSATNLSLTSFVLNGPGTIKFSSTPGSLGTVTGNGTIVCNGFWPTTSFATLTGDGWTGTLKIFNVTDCKGASQSGVATFVGLGSINSTVGMEKVTGWFDGSASCKTSPWKGATYGYALAMDGKGLTVSDGSSDTGYCFRELLGDGPINVGKSNGGPAMRFTMLDASNFAGAITNFGNAGITLGTPSRNPANGEMVVAAGATVTIPTGKVWKSTTATIDGTLCGSGTLEATTLTINGAVNTTNGVPNYSGTVAFGDSLTVTIPADATFSYCFLNGKNASPETTAPITTLVVAKGDVVTTNKHVVIKSSNGYWLKDLSYKTPFSLTITSASGNWSEQSWVDADGTSVESSFWSTSAPAVPVEISVVGSNTITLDSAVKVTSMTLSTTGTGSLTFAGDNTLTVQDMATIPAGVTLNKDKLTLPKVSGAGTLQTASLSANTTTFTDWTGTYEVTGNYNTKDGWNMTSYYSGVASKFRYTGTRTQGYMHNATPVSYGEFVLDGSITFNDGFSGKDYAPYIYSYTKLSGSGSWIYDTGTTPVLWFKDVADFTGTLQTKANGYRIVIGNGTFVSTNTCPVKGGLTVVGTATINPAAKIIAPSGVLVTNGTLTVASATNLGSAAITVGGNSKLVAPADTLTNNIVVDAGGIIDITTTELATASSLTITTGTFTNNGTVTINGAAIPSNWRLDGKVLRRRSTLYWIAQSGNWGDANVWAKADGTLVTYTEGDFVNFTNAAASVTLTANVTPASINVPSGAAVTINGDFTLGTPTITGAGTLAVNPGTGTDKTDLIPAASFDSFTGTYHIMSGRVKMTAAMASAVTVKVTDGAQIWLTGGTWNNRFELSGHGWSTGNDVESAALRLEGNQLGASSSIVFVEEDGYITPGIGTTGKSQIATHLSGCGFSLCGDGTLNLISPKNQACEVTGPVIINCGTIEFGREGNNYDNDYDVDYMLGTSVQVQSSAMLWINLCQHGGANVDEVDKSKFVTPIVLNGGDLHARDGSYVYYSVEVRADSTFTAGEWGKRHIFKELSGTGRLTVTSNADTIFGILGGDFTGTIYNNGSGKVTPRNNALAHATLELSANSQLSLIDSAQTIGKLIGGGKAYANQNATLTLKGGAYSGVIQNTSGGVGSTALALTIDGDVVLSGANTYTGLTTINEDGVLSYVAAADSTVAFPGGLAGTGTLISEGAGTVNLAGYRLTDGEGLSIANAGTIAFTLTDAETNGTAWVSFAKMLDDNVGNIALYNADGSANETFLLPKSINGVLMSKVKGTMPTPKYGYAFDGNLTAEEGCTALGFDGESGDSYQDSGHGKAYVFKSGYTPYGDDFAKPSGSWTIMTFAKPVATDHRVFWTLGNASDLFGLAVAPNRCVKVVKATNNTAHSVLLTSDSIEDFTLDYHLFVLTYDGTTLKLYVDGVEQGEGYAGSVSLPSNQKFQLGSIHGGAGYTGLSRGDDIALDEWRVYEQVLTDEQLVTLADEFKPWRANAVEKGSVLFIASSDDWDDMTLPTTAGIADAGDANISFANNAAYLRQLADGFATVALVSSAANTNYIYGLHAINGGDGIGAITRNVYLAMNSGTAYLISGGEDAGYATSTKTIPTGNLLTQLGGSAIVDFAFGAGHKGGWGGITAEVKGDTGVTITDDAQVRGTVAGGWSSVHQAQPKVSGNTSVLVRNVQRSDTPSANIGVANGYIVGGSIYMGNGGGGVITGNTWVTVDIDDSQSGTFVKNIVGGSYYGGGHDMTIGGSSTVVVSAPKTVSFTGTFYAGGYPVGNNSTVAGTASMFLTNANFNAATLKGGSATGAKSLVAYFDEDATFTPKAIDGFDTVRVESKKNGTVTLGKVFANQALTLASGNFELKDSSPITLTSLAFVDAPTLTIAPNKAEAAIQVTDGTVDLNGVTVSLDPLYFRDIPEDDASTYILLSAPTISTNGLHLGKGSWTLALEGTAGEGQTLKATRGKGFYFIIAKDELTEETYVEHDDNNTKQSLNVDAKWLVAKTELTEETVKDVDTVIEKLNENGGNGAKIYESYVLGLDPKDETSKPVIAPVQTDNPEEVTFKVTNVAVNEAAGANSVTYTVYSSSERGGTKTLETTAPVKVNESVGVELPTSGVKYYSIEVQVN